LSGRVRNAASPGPRLSEGSHSGKLSVPLHRKVRRYCGALLGLLTKKLGRGFGRVAPLCLFKAPF
jgi:hypothetical protein